MSMLSIENTKLVSDIVYAGHDGLSSDDSWAYISDLLTKLIPSDSSVVVFCNSDEGLPRIGPVKGLGETFGRDYASYFYKTDFTLERALAMGKKVYRPVDVIPADDYRNSELYVDFLRPHGVSASILANIGSMPTNSVWIGLAREGGPEQYSDEQLELFDLVQRHLTQAYDNSCRVAHLEREFGFMRAGMDQFARPIMIFEDNGRMIFMNQATQEFCKKRSTSEEDVMELVQATARGLIGRGMDERPGNLLFKNIILGNKRCIVETSPVVYDGRRTWITAIVDLTEHLRYVVRQSAQTFRLTNREIDICEELMRGLSNRDIAEKLFITEFTVKDHFKSITGKLHISNRTELALKLLGY